MRPLDAYLGMYRIIKDARDERAIRSGRRTRLGAYSSSDRTEGHFTPLQNCACADNLP